MKKMIEVAKKIGYAISISLQEMPMRWFIVRCEGRKVKEVAEALRGGYVPVMARVTKPARKKQPVTSEVPLFPGWVFVPFNEVNYRAAGEVSGVRGIMKYGRMGPLILEDADMKRVHEIEHRYRVPPEVPDFAVGEEVEVQGLLAGMRGRITHIRGEEIVVDVGGNFPVSVNHCLVVRLGV